MLIKFRIDYKTRYGQQMMIRGTHPLLGGENSETGVPMRYEENSDGVWSTLINLQDADPFEYRYYIIDGNPATRTEEWGENRCFDPRKLETKLVLLVDHWRSMAYAETALLSAAFTEAVFRHNIPVKRNAREKISNLPGIEVCFSPLVSRIMPGHRVAVTGSTAVLGNWEVKKALILDNQEYPNWKGVVSVPVTAFPLEYKYLILDEQEKVVCWEKCPNRIVTFQADVVPNFIGIRDEQFDFPGDPWKGAGTAIPVFSLRSQEGWGIGEFRDLEKLTDWTVEAGLQMIQTLPVNDTIARHTWNDSYPYAAISVFALHPAYINVRQIGLLKDKKLLAALDREGERLNRLEKIDYEGVMNLKSRYFKLIFDQQKDEFLVDPGFRDFFRKNSFWLEPYAAFSYLRDQYKTADFSRWESYSVCSPAMLKELTDPESPRFDDIAVHYFIQYHAHLQLSHASDYARSKGVALKGDLPIGIFRHSVDAWVNPELFDMERQTGAPPDDFSTTGQNWRFPTYRWEKMAEDQYGWWQRRLRHLSGYFDAFRIDHILGFFRIWEIPSDQVQGLLGYFNPSYPYSRNEILAKGIWFDENRYCRPFIRNYVLGELFGVDAELVKEKFLREYAPECFELLPEYSTQRKVEAAIQVLMETSVEDKQRWLRIRDGLYALIAEVIFLEMEQDGQKVFYPRHSLHQTYSYRNLDDHSRHLLWELYVEYFFRRNEHLWREKAMVKLPALKKSTNMLLCGEDLGMVPACVPGVMQELGLLSLEVQRMPKNPALEFGRTEDYPYLSVATPSSHDTSTIRGWWEESREKTQEFYTKVLKMPGEAPATCSPEIVRAIIGQHLYSPSMWAVFPIQDLLGMDEKLRLPDPHAERINDPGNPEHYWQYRMHLAVEQLTEEKGFTAEIRQMVNDSGRKKVY